LQVSIKLLQLKHRFKKTLNNRL